MGHPNSNCNVASFFQMKSRCGNFDACCVQILKAVNQLVYRKALTKALCILLCNHSHSILDLSSALSEFNFLHNADHANLSRILKNANHRTIWITLVVYIITPSCIFQDFRCALVHIVGNEFESH